VIKVVEKLEDPEYGRVWNRFAKQFQFPPGMSSSTRPAIKEPADSVTWSLDSLDDDPDYSLDQGFVTRSWNQ
jgi:hypothetical protein